MDREGRVQDARTPDSQRREWEPPRLALLGVEGSDQSKLDDPQERTIIGISYGPAS